jgi:hypothetical protein
MLKQVLPVHIITTVNYIQNFIGRDKCCSVNGYVRGGGGGLTFKNPLMTNSESIFIPSAPRFPKEFRPFVLLVEQHVDEDE